MNVLIRKAELKDIEAIQQIAKVSWNETYKELIPKSIQKKFLKEAYSDDFMLKRVQQTYLMVAEDEYKNEIVGFANAFTKDHVAKLGAIYLFPKLQGKGIGTKLLTVLIEQLKAIKEIHVEVEKGNLVGETFYIAKGFKVVKEYEDDLFGHKLQTKKMVLNIN